MNVYKVAANRSLQKTCPPNTLAAARGEQQQMPLGWLQELVQRNTAGLCARERLPSSHLTSTGGGEGPWWLQEPPRIVSSYGPAAAAVAAASAAARGEQQQMSLGRWLRSLCPLESLSAGSLSVVETRFRTAGLPTVAAVMDAHLTEPQLIALGLTQVRIRKDVLHAIQGARLQRAALSAVRSAADATPVDANATSHANTATRYFSMPSLPASYLLLNSS